MKTCPVILRQSAFLFFLFHFASCAPNSKEAKNGKADAQTESKLVQGQSAGAELLQASDILGKWRFEGFEFPGVSSLDSAEAALLSGTPIIVGIDSAQLFYQWCGFEYDHFEKLDLESFLDDMYRVDISSLQLKADSVLVWELEGDIIGANIILLNAKESLLIYEGVFFYLRKEADLGD